MASRYKTLSTTLVHGGELKPRPYGAVSLPIFQSSTFEFGGGQVDYHDVKYIRLNNTPNHDVLHQKIALLENAEAALVTASGMAAISTALLSVLKSGDHLLIQDSLYGGTHNFVCEDLNSLGISYDFVDGGNPAEWEGLLRPETRVIYLESISNPTMKVPDFGAALRFAKAHNLISMIDNTFPSPVNFRPASIGFDLSLHSATKYMNGHSDLVAGAIIGRSELIDSIRKKLNHFGGTLDPHTCYLLHRGIKTMALRVARQNENAAKIAEFLERHPKVNRVNYPGLPSHPQHQIAAEFFDGFGGMLSFEVAGDTDRAQQFMEAVELPIIAPSLGGVESLLTRPSTTSHVGMPENERISLGISDGLIRMSVGIEDAGELIEDLRQAL